ncbi:MAG: hypothetical protein GYA24_16245 [Candidatus Lokiarchaeota archaeon]|nr:hypothetical protein [Candidatus Lokiarchaeota archaeon]
MARRIFVTYSPFHVLTACGLASELGTGLDNILVFFKDFPDSTVYHDAIREWRANPFKEIHVMDPGTQYAQKSLAQRFGFSSTKLRLIKQFWNDHVKGKADREEIHIFSFNDDTVESQFLYWKNKKERNYYLEDGFSSYYFEPHHKNLVFHVKKAIRKVFFGSWVERPYPFGTSKKVSRVFSFFPDGVIDALRSKEIVELKPGIFERLHDTGLIDILSKRLWIGEVENVDNAAILLFPLSFQLEAMHLDIRSFTTSLIDMLGSSNVKIGNIFLKCHPRETSTIKDRIAAMFPGIRIIENSTSAEILYMLLRNKVKGKIVLVGSYSTAFITARVILGSQVDIICVLSTIPRDTLTPAFIDKMNIKQWKIP